MATLESRLAEMLKVPVEALGFQLWGIEYVQAGKHSILRVFIDGENGINIEDCANTSRQVSAVLDVEDPISNEYNLEVSSPGLDRPLFTLAQYQALIGQEVKVKTRLPQFGQRKFHGTLLAVENGMMTLRTEKHEVDLMFDNIDKGNLVAKF
ncbi:MAG: ribosome maturation factor RimP [Shewanella xiamenensis]|nr:ribosome maturation factor RimP [Shewanella xiamenensis]